jgi:hypothetical protein
MEQNLERNRNRNRNNGLKEITLTVIVDVQGNG